MPGAALTGRLERRTVLGAGALTVAGLLAESQNPGRRVGGELVDALAARTAHLRSLDDHLGGTGTYRTYTVELEATAGMIRDAAYTADTGRRLAGVLAEQAQQAQQAGWAAFDAGSHARRAAVPRLPRGRPDRRRHRARRQLRVGVGRGGERDSGDLRVLPRVMLDQVRFQRRVRRCRGGQGQGVFLALAGFPRWRNMEMTGPTICAFPASRAATADRARLFAESRSGVALVTRRRAVSFMRQGTVAPGREIRGPSSRWVSVRRARQAT